MENNVHPVYNVFTIPDSADLEILTFIKSLYWFNELIGLSDIFLTKYVLYFTINSLSKASYAELANEPVTKGGDVATCSSIIEINNYCQLCSIMYLVYCIQNTIKTYI